MNVEVTLKSNKPGFKCWLLFTRGVTESCFTPFDKMGIIQHSCCYVVGIK